jgi:toxin ParE1/3/4
VGRKVVWSAPAADDLVAAVEFIAKDSEAFAATLAKRVCDAGDSLAEFSERGRPFPDADFPNLRELIIGPYRLVYEVEPERVLIHGVFHGSRDVGAHLRRRT